MPCNIPALPLSFPNTLKKQRPKVKFTFKSDQTFAFLRLVIFRLAAADPTGWAHGAFYYFPFASSLHGPMELQIVSIQLFVVFKRK
jgi:hypothetical protein